MMQNKALSHNAIRLPTKRLTSIAKSPTGTMVNIVRFANIRMSSTIII